MEVLPCRMTPVKSVGLRASNCNHCSLSFIPAHHAPSYSSPSSRPDCTPVILIYSSMTRFSTIHGHQTLYIYILLHAQHFWNKTNKETLCSVVCAEHTTMLILMLLIFQNPITIWTYLWNVGWPECWDVLCGGLTHCSEMMKPVAGNQTLAETPDPLVDSL